MRGWIVGSGGGCGNSQYFGVLAEAALEDATELGTTVEKNDAATNVKDTAAVAEEEEGEAAEEGVDAETTENSNAVESVDSDALVQNLSTPPTKKSSKSPNAPNGPVKKRPAVDEEDCSKFLNEISNVTGLADAKLLEKPVSNSTQAPSRSQLNGLVVVGIQPIWPMGPWAFEPSLGSAWRTHVSFIHFICHCGPTCWPTPSCILWPQVMERAYQIINLIISLGCGGVAYLR